MQHIYCVFVLSDVSKNRLLCLCVTEKKDGMENPKRGRRQGAWQVRLHLLSNRSIVMAKFPSHLILSHSVCATHRRAHRWQKLDQSTPVSSSSSSKSSSLILPLLSSCVLLLYPPTAPLLLQTKVNTCQTDNQAWQMHSISRNTHSSYSQGSQKMNPHCHPYHIYLPPDKRKAVCCYLGLFCTIHLHLNIPYFSLSVVEWSH